MLSSVRAEGRARRQQHGAVGRSVQQQACGRGCGAAVGDRDGLVRSGHRLGVRGFVVAAGFCDAVPGGGVT